VKARGKGHAPKPPGQPTALTMELNQEVNPAPGTSLKRGWV